MISKDIPKKAALLILLPFMWIVLTAGVFSDSVRLKNVNGPFIDLDSVIADIPPGNGGNSETYIMDEEAEKKAEEESRETVVLTIEIREKEIRVDGTLTDVQRLPEVFKEKYRSGVQVQLTDDFAEYHTYISVKRFLNEKGIKPVEKQK